MRVRLVVYFSLIAVFVCGSLLPTDVFAQTPGSPTGIPDPSSVLTGTSMANLSAIAEVYVKGPKGEAVDQPAVVTLFRINGQVLDQGTTKAGFVKFDHVPFSEFKVQVIAPGYETATKQFEIAKPGAVTVTVNLQPMEAEDAAAAIGFYALPSKVQKDVGKALEALRANKPTNALSHLQAAEHNAPNTAEIAFLFGLYSSEMKDPVKAKSYWMKTLELNPKHLSALIEVGQQLIQENKPAEALPYLKRAVDAGPDSWRAQTLLSEACVMQGMNDEAVKHAQRAIDLGHDRASAAQLVLVRVLVQKHETEQAVHILEGYVKAHPADKETADYLNTLKNPKPGNTAAGNLAVDATDADALAVPSNWLPPDVDSSVPAVEPGATCALDDVLKKAGQRIEELMSDVDRFTATESLIHETINKYGLPSPPEKRKFNYVVSIQDIQHRYLNVEEYRNSHGLPADFPGGVATMGLPALVLIFHPYNTGNFAMACEGLARLSSGLAWQVHFRQQPDKPNTIKRYRIGAEGPSYPVALKGRAWISADTFQIVRLETDLIAPLPQIKLVADHADVEYGPVKFRGGTVSMWLPRSADVYYDWRGRKVHRRHSFSDYLLFGVDEKQKITLPKVDDSAASTGPDSEQNKKP
ncbi:MAG TPA: tetratricopeptide repeat protein [Candidatus Methylomirabilis sp.]|nr:tetratricopeptide repeat protein [Candidatus Methylomirabilis sp.]